MRTRSEVKRAREAASETRFSSATTDEPQAVGDASPSIVGGLDSGTCHERQTNVARVAGSALATLRAMPVIDVHPLRLYLLERDVTIVQAAELLGVSERALRGVLSGERRFAWWRENEIAAGLGVDVRDLFPAVTA